MRALYFQLKIGFLSGTALFGESGLWSLTSLVPPNLKVALGSSLGKRSSTSAPSQSNSLDWTPPLKRSKSSGESSKSRHTKVSAQKVMDGSSRTTPVFTPPPPPLPLPAESAQPSLLPLSEQQEKVLEKYLSQYHLAVQRDPKASRLLRKLKVRSKQRLYNHKVFDLDQTICRLLSTTTKYSVDKSRPYYEQVVPVLKPGAEYSHPVTSQSELTVTSRLVCPTSPQTDILDHLSLIPVLSRALPPEFKTFRQILCGAGDVHSLITSPYTTRKLKPFIFRSSELLPPKVRVNREIVQKWQEGHECDPDIPPLPSTIDFCYLQEHHLPAVNNFVSHFFWPVDLCECLQYPDFTCVVLYGKLVIGCGFMTPDVKVNEAYISFLAVHPDFQHCSIGTIILYHLIQSCMGKDVTLHVSVDNPAMLLYQTMGFKAERYCLDFYRHYYPEGHHLSKNAYFLRLRK